jgi:hypothetical protein
MEPVIHLLITRRPFMITCDNKMEHLRPGGLRVFLFFYLQKIRKE